MSAFSETLVLGARGLLGRHVVAALARAGQGPWVAHKGERFETPPQVHAFLEAHRPKAIINCIGYLGTDATEHYRTNGCLPRAIADWAHERAAFLHVSTNAVFAADPSRLWLPTDARAPSTPYEASKAFGEDPRAWVVRATFIGASGRGRGLFDRLRSGAPYKDAPYNGVTATVLAEHLVSTALALRGAPRGGVEHVHAGAPTRLSTLAKLLGSTSECQGIAENARLLGGGAPLPTLEAQLEAYLGA